MIIFSVKEAGAMMSLPFATKSGPGLRSRTPTKSQDVLIEKMLL
jgi:hypothetical protein